MLYEHIRRLYLGKSIGLAKVIHAYNNGWITKDQLNELMDIKMTYTKEEAIQFKKEECSYLCGVAISAGIDVVLSDGESHHFSLTENDQSNLNAKMLNILAGITELEYHSDGEPCKYYTQQDMATICAAAQRKVTIETTYNNCLYQWIKGCETVDEILAISYGADIPEEYWSEPWRNIIASITTVPEEEVGEVDSDGNVDHDNTIQSDENVSNSQEDLNVEESAEKTDEHDVVSEEDATPQ